MTKQILVIDGAQVEQQPINETIVLQGPLDVSTHYITSAAELRLVPADTYGVQVSNGGNARGEYSLDLQVSRTADTQVASGSSSIILGGSRNTANNIRAAVLSGSDNICSGNSCVIVSGKQANIDNLSTYSILNGGQYCEINDSDWSGIGVGDACTVNTSSSAVIGGGVNCHITNSIGGVVVGGSNNNVNNSTAGGICSGLYNTVNDDFSFIGGGKSNTINGLYCAIVCGLSNTIGAGISYCGILSGYNNSVSVGSTSTICSGSTNSITNSYSVICGGQSHSIAGSFSGVLCGYSNAANGSFSTALGGRENAATAKYSFAMGYDAKSTHQGEIAYSGSPKILNQGDSQRMLMTLKRATSNTTPRYMYVDGASLTMDIPTNTSWTFDILVNAFKTDGSATAGYHIRGIIYRDGTAVPVFAGTPTTTVIAETDAAWDCVVEATANRLDIKVTGAAATAINWTARVEIIQNMVTL